MSANPAHLPLATAQQPRAKRPSFRLKSDWAEWEATQIDNAIKEMEATRIPSYQWSKVKNKLDVLQGMRKRAASWRSKARIYRAQGN